MCFNAGIYNVEQREINFVYFNVDMNNVRQRRNKVVLFNVEFHNVGKRRNNVVKMTISKENWKIMSNWIHWIQSFTFYCCFIIFFILLPIFWGICWKILAKLQKLRSWKILIRNWSLIRNFFYFLDLLFTIILYRMLWIKRRIVSWRKTSKKEVSASCRQK